MNGIIGGYVVGAGARRDVLSPVFSPDPSTVEKLIDVFSEYDGLVVLRVVPVVTPVPCELALYAERGMFVLLLNTTVGDSDALVKILSVEGLEGGFVGMPGEAYPRRAVTRDFAVVRQMFRVVAELGTCSTA